MFELIKKIQGTDDFASLGAASDEQIQEAESKLHVTFADDFKAYLKAFGAAAFCGKELTGICASERLSVVSVTERARSFYPAFPKDAYVIEELLFDHILSIQKPDGTVFGYGPNDAGEQIAASLSEYLFPGDKEE